LFAVIVKEQLTRWGKREEGAEAMSEENKAIARRALEEVFSQGNLDAVDELVAPDFVEHEEFPGMPPGREGVKQVASMFRSAFPDLQVTTEDIFSEGDRVAIRSTWRGTQQGAFLGIAPTGRSVTFEATDILRVENGRIAEHWGRTDDLGVLQQLGVAPLPGQGES
jgi:steroid delta-isomerase-like uncharacterized protein